MKKMTFLLLGLFLVLGFTSAASYDNLYLTGNATDVGWTPNGIPLTKVEDGIFAWTGTLKGKDTGDNGQVRFKFLVKNDWSPSITCRFDVPGHLVLTLGEETDIYEFTGGPNDNAFQVAETGVYTLHVNLNTMKMTCALDGPAPINLNQLYMVGSGTNEEGNWDKDNPVEMTKVTKGIFIWSGELYNTNGNEMKFLNVKGVWSNTVNPLDGDLEFMLDTDYDLNYRPLESSENDFKFKVTTTDVYTIKVNLNTMKMRIERGNTINNPDLSVLYIAGSGTDAGWDNEQAIEMDRTAMGEFTWSGNLYTDNGGQFKFQNVKGIWSNSINPLDNDINFEINTDYDLNYRPYESSPNDFKFGVTTPGVYTIKVNLNTMKMRVIPFGSGIEDIVIAPFKVITTDSTIEVVAEVNNKIQSVTLFDICGKGISGKNVSNGVYVLKVKYDGKDYIQKVMVK